IAAPLVASNAAIAAASGIVVLAVLAWFKRCPAAAPLSIFCVICLSLIFSGVRYSPVILACGLLGYAGVVRIVSWLRRTATWARWGSFDASIRLLCVVACLLSAPALLSWYLFLHPNIPHFVKAYVPALPLGLLIVGGLIWAMLNAAIEVLARAGAVARTRMPGSSAASPCLWSDPYKGFSGRLARRRPRLHFRALHGSHPATRWWHVRSLDSPRFHRRRDRGNCAPPSATRKA